MPSGLAPHEDIAWPSCRPCGRQRAVASSSWTVPVCIRYFTAPRTCRRCRNFFRVALLHGPRGAGAVMAHEVDGLQTLFGDGHGGDAQMRAQSRWTGTMVSNMENPIFRLQAQRLGDDAQTCPHRSRPASCRLRRDSAGHRTVPCRRTARRRRRSSRAASPARHPFLMGTHIVTNGGVLRLPSRFWRHPESGAACDGTSWPRSSARQ